MRADGDDHLAGNGVYQSVVPIGVDEPHQRDIDQHQDRHGDEFLAGAEDQIFQLSVDHSHVRQLADDGSQGAFQAAVCLARHHRFAPLLPHLIVDGVFQVMKCGVHVRVNVLDAGEEPLEHEDGFSAGAENNAYYQQVKALADAEGSRVLPVCARFEQEIAELDEEERAVFMEELGMTESGLQRLIQASYELLGLISFLTAGSDEVRAWTIRRGTAGILIR